MGVAPGGLLEGRLTEPALVSRWCANLRARLFEKFGSVEEAQGGVRRGVGLGLCLVKLVATVHGGRAEVREHVR